MIDNDDNDPGLGLPASAGVSSGLPPGPRPRPGIRYSIPKNMVAPKGGLRVWARPDADLDFVIAELTPLDMERIQTQAGENRAVFAKLAIFAAIETIGGKRVRGNHDVIDQWWADIGPKGNRLVEQAFLTLTSVSEADVATFLDSGTRVE